MSLICWIHKASVLHVKNSRIYYLFKTWLPGVLRVLEHDSADEGGPRPVPEPAVLVHVRVRAAPHLVEQAGALLRGLGGPVRPLALLQDQEAEGGGQGADFALLRVEISRVRTNIKEHLFILKEQQQQTKLSGNNSNAT